jgi:imidazolonepropionase-like amidohydrolase
VGAAKVTSLLAAIALLALTSALLPQATGQQTAALAVVGGTLIDGTGAAPVPNSAVVIENGKIASVGPRASVRVPAGARVIDAKGKFVIPGMIDSHVHYRSWMGELFLNHGITAVFDLGDDTNWILGVRQAERAGRVRMPRIFVAGLAINRPGGNFAPSYGPDAGTPSSTKIDPARSGPAWARAAAKALIDKGVDHIKVTSDNLNADEISAIADEAHKSNKILLGHTTDLYTSIGNGFDGVTHLWGVSATLMSPENKKKFGEGLIQNPYAYMEPSKMDALVKFMVQHNASLNPLLVNEHAAMLSQTHEFELANYDLYMNPELRYVPLGNVISSMVFWHKTRSYSGALGGFPYVEMLEPQELAEAQRGYQNAHEFVRRFHKAGGRLIGGTDTGGSALVPGTSLLQEVQVFVDAGLTPMQALQTITKNPADFFRQADKVGTLKAGLDGDVVILDANPLSDVANLQKIQMVIKDGEVLDGRYHRDYHPEFWRSVTDEAGTSSSTADPPTIASVTSGSAVVHGAGPVELVVKGTAFNRTSLVCLNGRPLKTSFVSPTELRASVTGDQLPAAGNYSVTVTTAWPVPMPGLGGGSSEARQLTVN